MPTHRPNDPNNPKGPTGPDLPGTTHNAPSDDFMTLHQGSDDDSMRAGYELADANVKGAATFLVVLSAAVVVVFVLAFGIGKLINMEVSRQDGPPTRWSELAGVKPGNMESNPQMEQQQLQQMVARFPTPRVQRDDGNMQVARMHAREDMFLNHYSWVDAKHQVVRIPIDRAMELLAQRGLPVEGQQPTVASGSRGKHTTSTQAQSAAQQEQPMFGDAVNTVTPPLTDGFARTGPELRLIQTQQQRMETGSGEGPPEKVQPLH
ncbi:MAG TPA: hypothetical protein VFN53_12425 [Acidobacteriaceae bacterium]|nr:hypothetical protein [Acidobacteriaceae bacterium]